MASGTKEEFVQICNLLQELYDLKGQYTRFHQFMYHVNHEYYRRIGVDYAYRRELGAVYVQDMFYVENPDYIKFLQREIQKAKEEQHV
mgnify:CR=1 FL=1